MALGDFDPTTLANAAGERLINDSIFGALMVIMGLVWGVREWFGRRDVAAIKAEHALELEEAEKRRLEVKAELLQERTEHQKTREASLNAQLETLRVHNSVKETLDAFLKLTNGREIRG